MQIADAAVPGCKGSALQLSGCWRGRRHQLHPCSTTSRCMVRTAAAFPSAFHRHSIGASHILAHQLPARWQRTSHEPPCQQRSTVCGAAAGRADMEGQEIVQRLTLNDVLGHQPLDGQLQRMYTTDYTPDRYLGPVRIQAIQGEAPGEKDSLFCGEIDFNSILWHQGVGV